MRKIAALTAVVPFLLSLSGCAKNTVPTNLGGNAPPKAVAAAETSEKASDDVPGDEPGVAMNGTWVGAAAESTVLMSGREDAFVGVWVDVPKIRTQRTPVDLALIVDTSGSMRGEKIAEARRAARALVGELKDGDIVSIGTFSDRANELVPPTRLSVGTRQKVLAAIDRLTPEGSTNMFEGLELAQREMADAPDSHRVRRVVVLSDGQANIGPSSPAMLGALGERLLGFRAPVTSLGLGIDYDESTLNALAVRSSGRLYHLANPEETAKVLHDEMALVTSTVASDAEIEVVAAPGVRLQGADGLRADWRTPGKVLRIPLGALHAGQHKEALVRVRVEGASGEVPLASVRLRFRDASMGDLERVQETVAKVSFSSDASIVQAHANARTQSIAVIQKASKEQMEASRAMNDGDFRKADKNLGEAKEALVAQAAQTRDESQKKRLLEAASSFGSAQGRAQRAAAAPKAAQRAEALKNNADAMGALGY